MEENNNLYDYVLWNNTYEGMWYAIKREHITAFFAGGDYRTAIPKGGYIASEDVDGLIDYIMEG